MLVQTAVWQHNEPECECVIIPRTRRHTYNPHTLTRGQTRVTQVLSVSPRRTVRRTTTGGQRLTLAAEKKRKWACQTASQSVWLLLVSPAESHLGTSCHRLDSATFLTTLKSFIYLLVSFKIQVLKKGQLLLFTVNRNQYSTFKPAHYFHHNVFWIKFLPKGVNVNDLDTRYADQEADRSISLLLLMLRIASTELSQYGACIDFLSDFEFIF